ncbi:MAG TPA: ABC transporter permease [Bryobacteraceae bacterium]|nr:ABC transporter permease [Bryobacteraceae bacterium]
MIVAYERPRFELDASARRITATFVLVNRSHDAWRKEEGFSIGWQIYDPETSTFISEGQWNPLGEDLLSAQTREISLTVELPPERGHYHVYISPVSATVTWFYAQGEPFLLIDAFVEHGAARLLAADVTTTRSLRRKKFRGAITKVFTLPFVSIWNNWSLIASMTRRDVLQRYRGSFGDVLWTVLNPLLLMATYFFVFGIVLESRYGGDQSRTGFAFFFLSGMLPWLAISEAIGRAPNGILENRVLVKKVVFPVETLPVTHVIAGLVTQLFATAIFLIAVVIFRGDLPLTAVWLPVILVPQLLLTLGLAWFLSATGVYLRDIGQMIGFVLTLVFFLTPICYPETSLPPGAAGILTKNPVYAIVRCYRAIFLDGQAPPFGTLWKLWILSIVVFLAGHAWFYKLRKSFADVI